MDFIEIANTLWKEVEENNLEDQIVLWYFTDLQVLGAMWKKIDGFTTTFSSAPVPIEIFRDCHNKKKQTTKPLYPKNKVYYGGLREYYFDYYKDYLEGK